MKAKYLLFAVYSVAVAILLVSVIHSGYLYQFDPDELFHSNVVFLLRHGLVPYRDIFFIYSPLFQWFLAPLSFLTGFTFQFLTVARGSMIMLFIIRFILTFYIVRRIFGSVVAYMFAPLYLFDPFTVYTGMQVRPDNLMMTLYITGIFLVLHWFYNNKPSVLPWAGLLFGVSVVSLIKNIPATFFVTLFTLTKLKKTRNWRGMVWFMLALIFPLACFVVWASFKGVVVLMIQQVVFDAKQYIDTLRFPQNILNYYWPPNAVLYGFDGRPITWVYELCLPLIAFAGMFTALLNLHSFGAKRGFVGWFTVACFVQWVSLLFVRSVFVQYFLPISWFLAVFTAYALNSVYERIKTNRIYRHMAVAASILILLGGLCVSWRANNKRASISYTAQAAYFEAQWQIIPDTAVVFPGTLFRLSIYPIGYGWHFVDISTNIIKRYGSPFMYLSRYYVPYIVIDHYDFSFLDAQTQEYIQTHYQKNPTDQNMWILRS